MLTFFHKKMSEVCATDFRLFDPLKDNVNDEALLVNMPVAADRQKFLPGWNTRCLKVEEDY